jgi:hypothetical protein
MNLSTVTTVTDAYRAGGYLRQAIGSALAQTRVDPDVLVRGNADDLTGRRGNR